MKYMKEFFSTFQSKYVFSTNDVKRFFTFREANKDYYKIFLYNLQKGEKINRIRYGYYSSYSDIMLTGFSYYPSYYGLESALSTLKLWEQETNPVIITPLHVRTGLMQFNGRNYTVRKMSREMFFGYRYVRYFNFYIPVSDLEKTLVDFVYYNEKIPPELFNELKAKANKKILKTYISRITENRIRNKILKSLKLEL
jgi:predicted transcriptional regulator of viral defense system